MALTRARPVAGDAVLHARIAAAATVALTLPRDQGGLVIDVAEMRRRIADEHPRPAPLDLRNRRGGLVDLEFIAQYLMLREAARSPALLRRDIGAAIEALGAAGILEPQAAQELGAAHRLFCTIRLYLTLLFDGTPEPEALTGPAGATLARCAGAIDFARLDADISAACTGVLGWYDRLIAEPAQRAIQSRARQSETVQSKQEGGEAR
jgi:glutamate-ammonia-ligase adenylyltransferase